MENDMVLGQHQSIMPYRKFVRTEGYRQLFFDESARSKRALEILKKDGVDFVKIPYSDPDPRVPFLIATEGVFVGPEQIQKYVEVYLTTFK